jgi:methyltransferase (TIGR00027 family)
MTTGGTTSKDSSTASGKIIRRELIARERTAQVRVDVPSGIGWTALLASAARDGERAQAVPLVEDPWARMFAAAASHEVGRKIPGLGPTTDKPGSELGAFLTSYMLVRTLFIDEQVMSAIADGARQVVLLAAGLDSRAARLDYPSDVKVFEIDREQVLGFKSAVLAAHNADVARRVAVIADLTGDWAGALRQAGWRDDVPTCWVAEGILMYLGQPQVAALVASLQDACGAGDRLVTEYFSRPLTPEDNQSLGAGDREVAETIGAMLHEPPPAPAIWAQDMGLTLLVTTDAATELRRLGRPLPPLLSPGAKSADFNVWLVAASLWLSHDTRRCRPRARRAAPRAGGERPGGVLQCRHRIDGGIVRHGRLIRTCRHAESVWLASRACGSPARS